MYIVAIAWGYMVLMMSITETSFVAGVMTLILYGILPVTIILYIMGAPQRKRNRLAASEHARAGISDAASADASPPVSGTRARDVP